MSDFESTKGSGNIWNPTKDAEGDPKTEATAEDILDGYYVGKKENVGEHNSNVYTIQNKAGEKIDVWGTKTLNDGMGSVRFGQHIRIQWHGKKLTKAGALKSEKKRVSTDSFHDYEVFISKSVAPLANVQQSRGDEAFAPAQTASSARPAVSKDDDGDLPF